MSLLSACALALLLPPQEDVLAHYRLGPRPAAVTRVDVAVEMAFHLRRKDVAKDACQILIDSMITRRLAEEARVMPTDDEVRAFWGRLQEQLRQAGRDPNTFAAVRNSTEKEWLRDLGTQLAQERLVRRELELEPSEPVTGDMLRLWLADQRKRAVIVQDPDELPPGVAARVDGHDIPMLDLGLMLYRTSEDGEREHFIRQVVFLESIEHLARERHIEITPADLRAAIEQRRAIARADPRYKGLTFEKILASQGLTVDLLQRSRVFRANLLLEKLSLAIHPDAELRAEIDADRQAVLERFGARRHLGVIFRRALEEPNALVPDDFESATASLLDVRKRLKEESFDLVARIESDDPATKAKGGDLGWVSPRTDRLPPPARKAAFAAEAGALLGPIRADDGCYLIQVLEVEDPPDDAELLRRLRRRTTLELQKKILADAKIEWVHPEKR